MVPPILQGPLCTLRRNKNQTQAFSHLPLLRTGAAEETTMTTIFERPSRPRYSELGEILLSSSVGHIVRAEGFRAVEDGTIIFTPQANTPLTAYDLKEIAEVMQNEIWGQERRAVVRRARNNFMIGE